MFLKQLDFQKSFKFEDVKMWWKSEHGSLENDLKSLVNDKYASLLAICAEDNKCGVEIYTEAKSCSGGKTYMERLKEDVLWYRS